MKKTALIIILISSLAIADEPGNKSAEPAAETVNLHFTGKYCSECHEKTPLKGGEKYLRYGGDFSSLCKCHGYTSSNYIHPVDIFPSEEKKAKIPDDFVLKDGKISCSTCHDIYMQCEVNPELRLFNKRFLRDAPYAARTDICFKCHDEKKYKMLDPHNQLDANGNIIIDKCLYCHTKKPDEKRATFKDIMLIGDLSILCERCHGIKDRHPAGALHLRRPSDKFLKRKESIEKIFDLVMPLDSEGKMTCATCHNPHEKGVISSEREGGKGAGALYRQRLPENMCKICHGL